MSDDSGKLYVIAVVAGQRIALDAASVASVVDLTNIVPVPLSKRYILGLCTLRSLILTVVDLALAFGQAAERSSNRAITMEIAGHNYAFVVSSVEQVEAIMGRVHSVDRSIGEDWAASVTGRIETEGGSALLLNLRNLVTVNSGACFASSKLLKGTPGLPPLRPPN
jgi:purine-binding chemotaxis protein CheW